jgi:hypothetical protein
MYKTTLIYRPPTSDTYYTMSKHQFLLRRTYSTIPTGHQEHISHYINTNTTNTKTNLQHKIIHKDDCTTVTLYLLLPPFCCFSVSAYHTLLSFTSLSFTAVIEGTYIPAAAGHVSFLASKLSYTVQLQNSVQVNELPFLSFTAGQGFRFMLTISSYSQLSSSSSLLSSSSSSFLFTIFILYYSHPNLISCNRPSPSSS